MIKIFKYNVDLNSVDENGLIEIYLPTGAHVLSVGNQKDQLCVWAKVNTNSVDQELVKFMLVGTGIEIREDCPTRFLGTVLLHDGDLVIHVFTQSDVGDK